MILFVLSRSEPRRHLLQYVGKRWWDGVEWTSPPVLDSRGRGK